MKKELRDYLQNMRREFYSAPLEEKDVPQNPQILFETWFQQAKDSEILDPFAMTIASANAAGRPNCRVVYLRDINIDGLVFYTNYNSDKGRDFSENPYFSANFLWLELNRQVRFSGMIEKIDTSKSDDYFNSRPRESKIGAWASDQSTPIINREYLQERVDYFEEKFQGLEVPRPPHWGGYLLKPDEVEFWQGRASRLHDRLLYSLNADFKWNIKRLSP